MAPLEEQTAQTSSYTSRSASYQIVEGGRSGHGEKRCSEEMAFVFELNILKSETSTFSYVIVL
jgi:hypothetical protein